MATATARRRAPARSKSSEAAPARRRAPARSRSADAAPARRRAPARSAAERAAEAHEREERQGRAAAAETLQERYFGLSIGFQWLSVERAFDADDKQTAADSVDADARFISARRKLFDTASAAWKRVTEIRRALYGEWRTLGVPFPVAGVRLFRREHFAQWQERIATARAALAEAVEQFQTEWPKLIRQAESKLGRTFDREDYPADIRGSFSIQCDFPSLEAPEYLQTLNPEAYREQCEAVKARFAEAVTLAESTALDALNTMLTNLATRLAGTDNQGRPQQIRESALENLREFCLWFRATSVNSSADLDALVARVDTLATENAVDTLRDNADRRAAVATVAAELQGAAASMLRARPVRKITFAGTKAGAAGAEGGAQ